MQSRTFESYSSCSKEVPICGEGHSLVGLQCGTEQNHQVAKSIVFHRELELLALSAAW